jgi:hypothetical protein
VHATDAQHIRLLRGVRAAVSQHLYVRRPYAGANQPYPIGPDQQYGRSERKLLVEQRTQQRVGTAQQLIIVEQRNQQRVGTAQQLIIGGTGK